MAVSPRATYLHRSRQSFREADPATHTTPAPRISVIVPVHNGGAAFTSCCEALIAARGPHDELIIVADGESDGAWRSVGSRTAVVLINEDSRGPAVSRNRGARAASGDILFFVDADVVVKADTIEKVRAAFAAPGSPDAVIGSYDDAPGESDFLSQYRNLLHHHTHQMGAEDASTFWAGCGAIRREVFEAAGGFDERYRYPCVEDIELGYRLRKAGYQIRLQKELQVKHLKSWTARSIAKTDLIWRAIPWSQLLLQERSFENDLNINMSCRLSVMAIWALPLVALVGLWAPGSALALAVALVGLVVMLNRAFYQFLWQKRGAAFTLKALPWHAAYFAYSGLGFLIGLARHLRSEPVTIRTKSPVSSNVSQCSISQLSSSVPARQA